MSQVSDCQMIADDELDDAMDWGDDDTGEVVGSCEECGEELTMRTIHFGAAGERLCDRCE